MNFKYINHNNKKELIVENHIKIVRANCKSKIMIELIQAKKSYADQIMMKGKK